ncbi:MAG TPA: FixH family protein [Polyangia bacterium]|jgi:hypothetical protein
MQNKKTGTVAMLALVGVFSAAAVAGCGGSSATSDADSNAQFLSCLEAHKDTGVMPYVPDTKVQSSGGTFAVTLVESHPGTATDSSAPGPEVRGSNTWQVAIADMSGAPVDGIAMSVSPYMPDHQHGTSLVPAVTAQNGGNYQISPLYLYMTGYWEITVNLTPPAATGAAAGPHETALFKVCIP